MLSIFIKRTGAFCMLAALLVLQACNKEFEDIAEPAKPPATATIGEIIDTDANYSILKSAVTKAGLFPVLKNTGNKLTVFAVDNAAFAASGLSQAAIDAMSAAQLTSILRYHIIPQQLMASAITAIMPPVQMPTLLVLDPTNPFVKMNVHLSKVSGNVYVNNIPLKQADIAAANGVIHKPIALIAPPAALLSNVIYDDPQFSLFKALIARGDVGSSGMASFDFLLKFAVANLTVFAPTNTAVKAVITQLSGGMVPANAPDQAFIDFINTFIPVANARGIVAYHFLTARNYAHNFPTVPTWIPTALNAAIPSHPGVQVKSTFTGMFATSLTVTGAGNGGVASNVTTLDKNAVNGVVHIIDQVLLPQ